MEITEHVVELQTINHKNDLFNLVNLVQPGYFKSKTSFMGSYFGIFKDGQLVAVTGERMKMNVYTEVSAVVTHPGYTGRGFAKQLIAHTTNKIFSENKLPYLHVAETNTGAIKLYEKLGFYTRRKISLWNLVVAGAYMAGKTTGR
jgi:ribosomal protein S18 acetylase RimI-like enzyme